MENNSGMNNSIPSVSVDEELIISMLKRTDTLCVFHCCYVANMRSKARSATTLLSSHAMPCLMFAVRLLT